MNSAVSNLRPYGSQIVKLILFFYSDGAFFFGLSHFLVFLPYLSFLLWASNHFSLSLSLSLSLTKPRPQHQAKWIFIAMVFFFFFFLVCDLMVDSAVVVWIIDLAFWVISCLGFQFGHILVGLWFGFRLWVCGGWWVLWWLLWLLVLGWGWTVVGAGSG